MLSWVLTFTAAGVLWLVLLHCKVEREGGGGGDVVEVCRPHHWLGFGRFVVHCAQLLTCSEDAKKSDQNHGV